MADSADTAVRAVSIAITRPVQKVSGLAAGIAHGFATLKTRRDVGEAVRAAKEAAARQERDLEEELRAAGSSTP
jgi:F0F1-type ATP synthase membrane subunit c/vacuolar-type H+-ATPase subunit K